MNKKVEAAFNEHLNAELFSSYLYLAMANYFAAKNLDGMHHWMRIQVDEERLHGLKFVDFINNRNGRVVLKQIEQPALDWASPLAAFEQAYEHECLISSKINALVSLAVAEADHAAAAFLQWFVNEQVEEEANVLRIVERLKLIGDNGTGLLMLDDQLGQRVATAPADGAGGEAAAG
jgi:ferritin